MLIIKEGGLASFKPAVKQAHVVTENSHIVLTQSALSLNGIVLKQGEAEEVEKAFDRLVAAYESGDKVFYIDVESAPPTEEEAPKEKSGSTRRSRKRKGSTDTEENATEIDNEQSAE